ncbi:NAD(P)H-binding protein [Isoptericola sp. S6320L]|uniref:SDR family oxidoreductase n=1 Tax=Isoptericola sp. S6320L TaxID=2926411 RepID=UPI001FF3BDEC|nr:NAD(P)H-binding protein [Isoptericola sp. S6320L]MCK0116964.1 NAD(P)H-binding protein [Isoptericola sp. S6320L]
MRIAVAGGTGVVGRHVVAAVERAGHEAVVLSRGRGVDVATGSGLDAALEGVDAVVDTLNVTSLREKVATEFFTTTSRHLVAAGVRAGVGHHVLLSIVGIDRASGYGYYRAKLEQEEVVRAGDVPWSVVRATQFHEFPGQVLGQVPGPVGIMPRMRCRPVAAAEVGTYLAEVAAGPARGQAPEIAGPREEQMVDMARRLLRARGRRRWVLPVDFPGAGAAFRGGALLPDGEGPRGSVTFDEWLSASPA